MTDSIVEEDSDLDRYSIQELEAIFEEIRRVARELDSSYTADRIEDTIRNRSDQLLRVIQQRKNA